MAKCSKCESTLFKVENVTPSSSNYILLFVCCSRCSATIGVLDYYNIGAITKGIEEKIKHLESELSRINSNIDIVNRNVQTVIRNLQQ